MKNLTYTIRTGIIVVLAIALGSIAADAEGMEMPIADTLTTEVADTARQDIPYRTQEKAREPIVELTDTISRQEASHDALLIDTVTLVKGGKEWKRPNPKRAMWLALVLPGAGQIYNNKLWKLPIFYGGFLGCIYALRWNNQQYKDYSQAYLDICDDDPNTQSYNQYLHVGRKIEGVSQENYYRQLFKKRKDFYRRYRDMSFFVMIGVYALSVIDAYVDASLAQFDISDDLSLQVAPSVINCQTSNNPFKSSAIGLQCSINF